MCHDCGVELAPDKVSALKQFCKNCFCAEAAVSTAGGVPDLYYQCVLCAVKLAGENKSAVKGCCTDCYKESVNISEGIQATEGASFHAASPGGIAGNDTGQPQTSPDPSPSSSPQGSPLTSPVDSPVEADPPPGGWGRQKRESEARWFARVQAYRHDEQKRKQTDYEQQWHSFSSRQKERFHIQMVKCAPELAQELSCAAAMTCKPWEKVEENGRFLVLPSNYTVKKLREDFQPYAEHPAGHEQARWHMYGLVHLLLSMPDSGLKSAAMCVTDLADLKVNKHQLYKIRVLALLTVNTS